MREFLVAIALVLSIINVALLFGPAGDPPATSVAARPTVAPADARSAAPEPQAAPPSHQHAPSTGPAQDTGQTQAGQTQAGQTQAGQTQAGQTQNAARTQGTAQRTAQAENTGKSQSAGPAATGAAGDANQGRQVYRKCQACHSLEPGKNTLGPTLAGIVGKKAASVPNFSYS